MRRYGVTLVRTNRCTENREENTLSAYDALKDRQLQRQRVRKIYVTAFGRRL